MTGTATIAQGAMKDIIEVASDNNSVTVLSAYDQCPVCCERKPSHPWLQSKIAPADLLSQWSVSEEINCHFDYVKCPVCRTLFVEQYPDEKSLVRLYATCSDNVYSGDEIAHRRTQLSYLKILEKYVTLNSSPTILEFGPDVGVLAKAVSDLHAPSRYVMVEPNSGLHASLSTKIPNAEIWNDGADLAHEPDQTFDLIILVHVLDHMLDPIAKLEEMHRLLKPGGYLFTVTHNHNSMVRRVLRSNWPPYCLHHPQLFNERSKHIAFSNAGFEKIVIDSTVNYFPFGFLVSRLFTTVGLQAELSFGPVIKIKTGNIFGVARK